MRSGGILEIGLAALLRTVVAGSIRRRLRRVALLAALAALAGLALLAGLGAAIAALWLWLSAELGPVHAALVMAAGFVALGAAMLLVLWLLARRPQRNGGADGLLRWLKAQSKDHQGELILAAILAGLVAGLASSKSSHAKPDD
jgi:hypothetical protein